MNNKEQEKNLEFQVVENATIFPCKPENGKPHSGIFDSHNKLLEHSLLFRKLQGQIIFPIDNKYSPQQYLNGTYIFAGYLIGHYGHFLLESLARLWYIKKHPELPIIWVKYAQNCQYFHDWQEQIFNMLDIKNKEIIIEKPTSVENIIIPEPGCVLWDYFTTAQSKAVTILKGKKPRKGQNIWLSRSQCNPRKTSFLIYNEKQLENILQNMGWLIFHPQEYTIRNQLDILASAEQIAGFEGSAFHSLILLEQVQANIKIFARRKLCQGMETYTSIAKTKQLKQTEHFVAQTKLRNKTKDFGAEVCLIHSYREIIDILNNTEK